MTIPSISGISDIGKITSESISVVNNLLVLPMPVASTAAVTALNILGKQRNINISGIFEGIESQRKAFIDDIENWVNNSGLSIQTRKTYTSFHGHTYLVICQDFSWASIDGSPSHIAYSMSLIECNVLSGGG